MKLNPECVPCLVRTKIADLLKAKPQATLQDVKRVMSVIYQNIHELPPPVIATYAFREVKRVTGINDPYFDLKSSSIEMAIRLRSKALEHLSLLDADEALTYAVKIALIGNSLDVGVAGYQIPSIEALLSQLEGTFVLDDVAYLRDFSRKSRLALYLLDNAGEAVLDCVLAQVLKNMGLKVIAVVKSGSFQDDITVDYVEKAGLQSFFDEVIDNGSDSACVLIEVLNDRLRELVSEADFIVSKGMANYEYISEPEVLSRLNKPIFFLLRAKCPPVAKSLGVSEQSYVIKLFKSQHKAS